MNDMLHWEQQEPTSWDGERGTDGGRRARHSGGTISAPRAGGSFAHVADLLEADDAEISTKGVALLTWLGAQPATVRTVAVAQLTSFLNDAALGRKYLAILEVLIRSKANVSERLLARAISQRPIADLHLHALALARSDNVIQASGELGTAVTRLLDEIAAQIGSEFATDVAVDALATLAICEPATILSSAGTLVARLTGFEQTRVLDAVLLACQKHCSFASAAVASAVHSRWQALVAQVRSGESLDGDVPGAMARLLEIVRRTGQPGAFEQALKDIEGLPAEFRVLYQLVSLVPRSTDPWIKPLRVRCLCLLKQKEQWTSLARMIASLAGVDPDAVSVALASR